MEAPSTPPPASTFVHPPEPTRSLLHEWFVEYNPTYLFSAALVLAGLTLVSCDLAASDALEGLGLSVVSEIYALALIGGAALLFRLGHRRVAVMVGLLAALYQCDVSMHVERCAYLGDIGVPAALAWALLFHGKLRLLAAALRLRASRSALSVPTLGAAGLAMLPHALAWLDPDGRARIVAIGIVVVGAAGLWTARTVDGAIGFDYRGRRAIRGTWLLWATGGALHVAYVALQAHVDPLRVVPVLALLATRWTRSERATWATAAAALAATGLLDPAMLSVTAATVALVLVLRAFRMPTDPARELPEAPRAPSPYRGAPSDAPAEPAIVDALPAPTFAWADPAERRRLLVGATASAHLGAWTALATQGLHLHHVVWLDLLLAATVLAWAWATRRPSVAVPLVPVIAHWLVATGTVAPPRGAAEYGVWSIAIGFALLGGSLATTWWSARMPAREG